MFRWLLPPTLLLFAVTSALAQGREVKNLGAHRMFSTQEFEKVIDTRCTICHTRQRVDIAIRERKNMEKIEQQMLHHGAVLSPREKEVLGAFWGDPLKGPKPR